MNWKLIFLLSLFGLAMSVATVYLIPSNDEGFFWLPIFVVCAYLIAKNCTQNFFFNGLMVSIVNSVWISLAHVILFDAYTAHHAAEAKLYLHPAIPVPPRVAVFVLGVLMFGVASGLVLGLFSFIASKLVKRKTLA